MTRFLKRLCLLTEAASRGNLRLLAVLLASGADEDVHQPYTDKTAAQTLEYLPKTMPLPAPVVPWTQARHPLFDAQDRRSVEAVPSLVYRPPTYLTYQLITHILGFTIFYWFRPSGHEIKEWYMHKDSGKKSNEGNNYDSGEW